jgi:hypothetical protein
MSAHEPVSAAEVGSARERRMARVGAVLWPSFLVAAVLDAVVFSLVDPASLHGFAHQPYGWSDMSVYTVGFFLFWAGAATASAVSQWLTHTPAP